MDRIKAKLEDLRQERDAAFDRAEAAETKLRIIELEFARVEQERNSLDSKSGGLDEKLDKALEDYRDLKAKYEALQLHAEESERAIKSVEQDRDLWEKKHEELLIKYQKVTAEMAELESSLGGL